MTTQSRPRRPLRAARRARVAGASLTLLLGAVAVIVVLTAGGSRPAPRRPWDCVSANSLSTLTKWGSVLGRPLNCAVAYIDAAPNWRSWENPWITQYRHNLPRVRLGRLVRRGRSDAISSSRPA